MNKKAQGISINVIIIAAIALLVLVILAVLLLRSGSDIDKQLKSCIVKGGKCQENRCATPEADIDVECPNDRPYCCAVFPT